MPYLCGFWRFASAYYEKNKKGESYCKTNNVIKKEKLLLKLNHRLTNIRKMDRAFQASMNLKAVEKDLQANIETLM